MPVPPVPAVTGYVAVAIGDRNTNESGNITNILLLAGILISLILQQNKNK